MNIVNPSLVLILSIIRKHEELYIFNDYIISMNIKAIFMG